MKYQQESIKPYSNEGAKGEQVERMFDQIAHSYDFLNHTLSLGIDRSWRKAAIDSLKPYAPQRILDVATGTGDFALMAVDRLQPQSLIGADLSEGMLSVGREKVERAGKSDIITLQKEDCMALSFEDNTFDAVTVARPRTSRDAPCAQTRWTTRHHRTHQSSSLPHETALLALCPCVDALGGKTRFTRQPSLFLSACYDGSLPTRRSDARHHRKSGFSIGEIPPFHFRTLHALHGGEIAL